MEKILLFQATQVAQIKKIASAMRIRVEEVSPTQYYHKLGVLAGVLPKEEVESFTGEPPTESMMVFCGLTDKHFNAMLQKLRLDKILVTYKAVITSQNMQWNILRLYMEMERERKAYENL
ncbi:DUF3783 domain-containing protein [Anaerosporobacter faecicola]|uniref:DUF3783 domain-containing protein n=1 Tax=Anaerosporobacter faecicola TaxID=2718714 RepID=UPI00143B929A|nr:DUF3783 domain-containing protein [Anaerosporobacter faecicola]